MLAARAETGEVRGLRLRTRSANTARGARRFIEETIASVRRARAAGPIVLRADSDSTRPNYRYLPGQGGALPDHRRHDYHHPAAIEAISELGCVPLADYPQPDRSRPLTASD